MKIFLLCIISFVSIELFSQQETAVNWFENQEEAMAFANEKETNILMVFAGSDWCRPCKKFKKDILMDSDFQEYIKENLTILYLDFPSKKKNKLSKELTKQNEALAEKYNRSGSFPKIILFDKDLNKIKSINYEGQSAKAYLKEVTL